MRKPTVATNPSAKNLYCPSEKNSIPLDNKQTIMFLTDAKVTRALQIGKEFTCKTSHTLFCILGSFTYTAAKNPSLFST